MAFSGFTDATSGFFIQIRMNNNSVYFNEHRRDYERDVKAPIINFAQVIAPAVLAIDPALETRPNKVVARIRRDTRFSKDKSPYRDHLWLNWRAGDTTLSKSILPGLHFGLEVDTWDVGFGYHEATPTTMRAFREKILAAPRSFLAIAEDPALIDNFTFHSEEYKNPKIPKDADGRLIPWLRTRCFYLEHSERWDERVYSPDFIQVVAKYLTMVGPFYRYLSKLPVVDE